MRKKIIYLLFLLFIVFFQLKSYSQVTIGENSAPALGALLQLKENDNNGTNSIRGFAMPRVSLTELTSLVDITGNPDKDTHIGLMVYNINSSFCSKPMAINPGLYVWHGDQWMPLKPEDTTPAAGVGSVTDQNGNFYPTMHYVTTVNGETVDAGIWMTENLRATSYDSGITSPPTLTESNVVAGNSPTYYYPKPTTTPLTGVPATDRVFFDQYPEFGLLYNWHAVVAGKNTSVLNQGHGQTNEQTEVFQGICPNGWHIPSDKEWNMLEKVIALSPEKYSTYPAGSTPWNDQWFTSTQFRPSSGDGHGLAMQMPCKLPESRYDNPNGKSLPTYKGGFSCLFVGFIRNGGMTSYGFTGIYWTSSNYNTVNSWYRQILLGLNGVDRNFIGKNFLGSVRCKKDNPA